MYELSIKKAFNRHASKIAQVAENESGVLSGGFSNFPKAKAKVSSEESLNGVRMNGHSPKLKASRFNSFIPYEGKILGFNAFTQRFLVMDSFLLDLLNAATLEEDINGLGELHPEFYHELGKHGFILDREVDELQKVKEVRKEVDFSEELYQLTINPTMNCNFKCWYCYESHIKGSKMNPETIVKIKKHIDHVMATNNELKYFYISWFGGEPMLYFDHVVKPIVEHAYQKAQECGIEFSTGFTTNGYLIKERMIPFFKANRINHFQITLDGAREKHNTVRFTASKAGTFDKIIQGIKLLCNNQINVSVRINYTDETLDKIEEIINEFDDLSETSKSHIKFSFHNVWQDNNPNRNKLEKIVTNFRRHDFTTVSTYSSFNTLRDSCYADRKNHATINYNGEVFKCTARDFKSANKEGDVDENGNIIWNEKFEKRMNAKFKNSPCLSCRIQPICNGGCSQHALEYGTNDYCVVEGSGITKDDVILSKFKQILEHQIILRTKFFKKIRQGVY